MIHRMITCTAVLALAAILPLAGADAAKLIVTNATLLTLEEGQEAPFVGHLVVGTDGRILAVGPGTPPASMAAATTVDATGKIVMPGFLSGHSHLWQSAFRGIAADQWVSTWVQRIHRTYGPHFVAGDPYMFTLHGALDYLRHGITTTYNYSQGVGGDPELYLEQFDAELAAGARFIFGYALSSQPSIPVAKERFVRFLERVRGMPANPLLLKVNIASGGGARQGGTEFVQLQREMMEEFDLDMQMHFQEVPTSKVDARANFAAIEAAGYLGPKLVFAHFIHTDDYIVTTAGQAGAGMIWNPLSNGRLASGLADIPKYQKAGISIGMGIDGQASADISDPLENCRLGLYQLRMRYEDAKVMQPLDVLRLHTIGTARTLGVADEVGTLKPGKFADFLVINPADFDTGPVSDVYATLVFACSIANLERVYVGGEWVVERGRPRHHDIGAISAEVKRRVDAIRERQRAAASLRGDS